MNLISDATKIAANAINGNAAFNQAETKRDAGESTGQKNSPNLPWELIQNTFSYLNLIELGDCRFLSKKCKLLVADEGFLARTYADRSFGKKKWAIYLGDIPEEPALPKNIHSIMQAPCPIWKGKKVLQTHVLALIPKSVNKEPLTIKSLATLVKVPRQGKATRYGITMGKLNEITSQTVDRTHWVLMTRDVLPDSHTRTEEYQSALVATLNQKAQVKYEVPKVIQASVCIFMKYITSGMYIYNESCTRCQEKGYFEHDQNKLYYPLVVGDCYNSGLAVSTYGSERFPGLAVLRIL